MKPAFTRMTAVRCLNLAPMGPNEEFGMFRTTLLALALAFSVGSPDASAEDYAKNSSAPVRVRYEELRGDEELLGATVLPLGASGAGASARC